MDFPFVFPETYAENQNFLTSLVEAVPRSPVRAAKKALAATGGKGLKAR